MGNKLFLTALQIIFIALSTYGQDFDLEAFNDAVLGSDSSDLEVINIPKDEGIVSISEISDEEFPEEEKPDFGQDSHGEQEIKDAGGEGEGNDGGLSGGLIFLYKVD